MVGLKTSEIKQLSCSLVCSLQNMFSTRPAGKHEGSLCYFNPSVSVWLHSDDCSLSCSSVEAAALGFTLKQAGKWLRVGGHLSCGSSSLCWSESLPEHTAVLTSSSAVVCWRKTPSAAGNCVAFCFCRQDFTQCDTLSGKIKVHSSLLHVQQHSGKSDRSEIMWTECPHVESFLFLLFGYYGYVFCLQLTYTR